MLFVIKYSVTLYLFFFESDAQQICLYRHGVRNNNLIIL